MKKTSKYIALLLLGFILSYVLSAMVLPHFTIKANTVQTVREINIFIKSNGIHTDIVLPIKNKYYDWSTKIKQAHTKQPELSMNYVGFGWGDKGFYLNTPTWSDLTAKTAFKAAFGFGGTALHTTYYQKISTSDHCVQLQLTEQQYKTLCQYILNSALQKNNAFIPIDTNANYGNHDAFYEATGTYHLFNTCNTWTNTALKKSGQNACLWTVTANQLLIKNN
ncbi:TIGR02117 family protein [Flavicella sediminum]|uniref:TIGR02117 family protein n=1 Tax=Flavicella sediminum TaxID=2585141 RepID=UPI00111CA66E|nr:TIGR02117 family protein [Flavicella sediminum]